MTESPWTAPGSASPPTVTPPPPYAAGPGPSWQATPQPPQASPPPPPPSAWRPAVDFRPGIIPLRPLQLGDLFGAVFKAIRGNVAATVGLAALTSAVALVPFTALGTWIASLDTTTLDESFGAEAPLGPGAFASYLPSLASAISSIMLAGFLAYVIGQAVLGRKVTMGETWRGTKGRLLALIGATVLVSLAMGLVLTIGFGLPVGIGVYAAASGADLGGGAIAVLVVLALLWLLILIAALIVVMTRLSFATSAIVLERLPVLASLRRSWTLVGTPTRKPFWRIFGLRLLTAMLVGAASSVVMVPLMIVMMIVMFALLDNGGTLGDVYMLQTVLTGVIGIIAGALTTPFTAGLDALLYVDARMRTEGLDVTLMRAAEGTIAPPWQAAEQA